jgi:hypothetical protein
LGELLADKLSADKLSADKLVEGKLSADKLSADELSAGELPLYLKLPQLWSQRKTPFLENGRKSPKIVITTLTWGNELKSPMANDGRRSSKML